MDKKLILYEDFKGNLISVYYGVRTIWDSDLSNNSFIPFRVRKESYLTLFSEGNLETIDLNHNLGLKDDGGAYVITNFLESMTKERIGFSELKERIEKELILKDLVKDL